MDQKPQHKKHRHWPRKQVGMALILIPIGLLFSFWGFAQGLGAKDHGDRYLEIAQFFLFGGLYIAGGGIIWIIVLLIRRFVLRRLSLRP